MRKPVWKGYRQYSSNYRAFWKRQWKRSVVAKDMGNAGGTQQLGEPGMELEQAHEHTEGPTE